MADGESGACGKRGRMTQHPTKVLKHLLVFAVARLLEHGDKEAVEEIMRNLPPAEKKG